MACCAIAAFIVMKMISVHGTIQAHTDKLTAHFGVEETATCRLKITGITCPACTESIESKMGLVHGVKAVNISPFLSQAVIEYLPQVVLVEELITNIEDAGFGAERIPDDQNWTANIQNANESRARQIEDWKKALYGSGSAAIAIIAIGLLPAHLDSYLSHHSRLKSQAILCAILIGVFGRQIHYESLMALQRKTPDMSLLMSLGTASAFLGSLYNVWDSENSSHSAALEFASFESTAILMCVVLGGRLLKSIVVRQSFSSLSSLASLVTETAELVTEDCQKGTKITVSVEQLQVGDYIAVRPGDIIPVDGKILRGIGYVGETHVTGEILPVHKFEGANVYAGSVIHDGHLVIQITQKPQLTWLQHTVQLMSEGDAKKGSIQTLAEYLSARFAWFIIIVAVLTILKTLLVDLETWSKALYRVTAIFLSACPCALGLASPTTILVGLGKLILLSVGKDMLTSNEDHASKRGILMKGGSHSIEAAARINSIFLDKTGTLTNGKLSVLQVEPSQYWNHSESHRLKWWLAVLATVQSSKHPVSQAITSEAQKRLMGIRKAVDYAEVVNFVNFLGQGAKCDIRLPTELNPTGETICVLVGNKAFFNSNSVQDVPETDIRVLSGKSAKEPLHIIDSYIAFDGVYVGRIRCIDKVRDEAAEMVRTLKSRGYNVGMVRFIFLMYHDSNTNKRTKMTGGDASAAHPVAQAVGIHPNWVHHDMLPQDKLRIITKTRQIHGPVAMVGDNLNDIQAMTAADLSVAAFVDINSLTAVTADVLFLAESSDRGNTDQTPVGLAKTTYILQLSREIYKKIWQNLLWAIVYNTFAVVTATGALESYGVILSPYVYLVHSKFS